MKVRISKSEWRAEGGLSNPRLYRRGNGIHWTYWRLK